MRRSAITCAACGRHRLKPTSAVNRAKRAGLNLYCDRTCAGVARRVERSEAERRRIKAEYDAARRIALAAEIKAAKRARHLATYDPDKERVKRAAKMPRHVEYCRRPAYREQKKAYDRQRRCKLEYGPFWEAASVLFDVEAEVRSRASDYEIRVQNGTLNKKLNRRREYDRQHA